MQKFRRDGNHVTSAVAELRFASRLGGWRRGEWGGPSEPLDGGALTHGMPMNVGEVTHAMAMRVKYRKMDSYGKPLRKFVPIMDLGVHQRNRGGVYPSGPRLKELCKEVGLQGFRKEEPNHACVVVEELAPAVAAVLPGSPYEPIHAYNLRKTKDDSILCDLFTGGSLTVRLGTLSHTHIVLVLRAWVQAALWEIPADEERQIIFCDTAGRLSLSAVAEHNNFKEMLEVLKEGLCVEILSGQIDVEEPGAASAISWALNEGNNIALATSEITAMSVLSGEIMTQMSKDKAQQVAYDSVVTAVKTQLGNVTADPDLPELFDFLLKIGTGRNSYIDDLLQFLEKFVNSKKRKMRLSAFKVANGVGQNYPATMVAVIKRGYRKNPKEGYVPCPEAQWAAIRPHFLRDMEDMLRFFHQACKPLIHCEDLVKPQDRLKLLGNIDVAIADSVFNTAKLSGEISSGVLRDKMAAAALPYFKAVGLPGRMDQVDNAVAVGGWIVPAFQRLIPSVEAPADVASSSTDVPEHVKSNVVVHDEKLGRVVEEQEMFKNEAAKKPSAVEVSLPWRKWLSPDFVASKYQGKEDADLSSVVTELAHLHEFSEVAKQQVDVKQEILSDASGKEVKGRIKVVTMEKIEKGGIMLPPCVMKGQKVVPKTDHTWAVQVTVQTCKGGCQADAVVAPTVNKSRAAKTAVAEPQPAQTKIRHRTVFINPEFSAPSYQGVTVAPEGGESVTKWKWSYDHSESMHPFWAIQRKTKKQMAAIQGLAEKEAGTPAVAAKLKPRFNTEILGQTHTQVFLSPGGVSSSKVVTIPYITNTMVLEKGEELWLEVQEPKAKEEVQHEISWKQKRSQALQNQSQEKAKKQKAGRDESA